MPNHNYVCLIGHLGGDPIKRSTGTGKTVTTFTLATSQGKDDNKKTQWHKIVAWEKIGDLIATHCKKGHAILIEGQITYREYTPKDSEVKQHITEIIASRMEFISSPKTDNKPTAGDDNYYDE